MIPQTALTLMQELTAVEVCIKSVKQNGYPYDTALYALSHLNRERKRILRKLLENPHRNP